MRSSDIDLLQTFSKCLSLNNKIGTSTNNGYSKKPSYRIQFGNIKLYKWLIEIGLHPNKTLTIGEINLPDKYFKDFLRGHLDGDGSIITYCDQYNYYLGRNYTNQRIYLKFISASEKHIYWLLKKIIELAGVKGSLTCTRFDQENKNPLWVIRFAKKESINLLTWIYYKPNLPSLERNNIT